MGYEPIYSYVIQTHAVPGDALPVVGADELWLYRVLSHIFQDCISLVVCGIRMFGGVDVVVVAVIVIVLLALFRLPSSSFPSSY